VGSLLPSFFFFPLIGDRLIGAASSSSFVGRSRRPGRLFAFFFLSFLLPYRLAGPRAGFFFSYVRATPTVRPADLSSSFSPPLFFPRSKGGI